LRVVYGSAVEVMPGIASSVGNLYAVYPSRRYLPPAVTAFVDMVVERMLPLAVQLGAQVAT
jgi:DNA-binding transcriptional LysR family regulator